MDILVAPLLAAAAGAVIVWLALRGRAGVLAERLRAAQEQIGKCDSELTGLRGELLRASTTTAELAAKLEAERQRLAEYERIRSGLKNEFQAAADKLLEEKSLRFTEQNKNQIDGLLNPLRQQLTDFRGRIDTVYKTESDDRAALKAQIEQLRQLNSRITDEAHELTTALKGDSQTRGAWGELILERLLEGSGLRAGEEFVAQETVTKGDGTGRNRPDIILRLPGKRHLVIDSKVSLVDYVRSVNAVDPSERAASLKAHVEAVRGHIKDLAGKEYQDSGELFTPDYVLMFVPIEPAFSAALENDGDLYYWAFDRRVILVTTASLLVTLKTVATFWLQDRQSKNVLEIARRGGLLYDKFVGLFEDLEAIGQNIARTRESYDDALAKLKTGQGNLLGQVELLKSLGAKAQKALPASELVPEHHVSMELTPPASVDTASKG